jgi:hypothetical protein
MLDDQVAPDSANPLPGRSGLFVTVDLGIIPRFYYFLQLGFGVPALVGCSVRALLCEQLGLAPEYVAARISTVFLDGKPVDDLDTALVRDGATLALSAALPGLVGATLRCGGAYAALRSSITYVPGADHAPEASGSVVFKLFNLLQRDLGALFLQRGIVVKTADLMEFFAQQATDFWQACGAVDFEGRPLSSSQLIEGSWAQPGDTVVLVVRALC